MWRIQRVTFPPWSAVLERTRPLLRLQPAFSSAYLRATSSTTAALASSAHAGAVPSFRQTLQARLFWLVIRNSTPILLMSP